MLPLFTGVDMKIYLVAFLTLAAISGCYRMPTDDDYCLIPTTNNPTVTRETASPLMPGMKM